MFEHDTDHHIILNRTLKLEQMFAAGGGWQDQIGGMIGGVKYIESQPCDESKFVVDLDINHLDPFLFLNNESQKCFTLYYTGITRLAKSILKNVVSRVVNEEKEYLDIHDNIKHLAERARSAISKRNITDLGNTIKESWDANKNIHDSTSNEYIDNLLKKLKPYYIGAKLLGAGGGGYCLFVSESPEQAQKLRKKINELSKGTSRIVEWSLNTEGLRVSLS
jgi:galactokinase/mevalonate kinase-like predicted kinase